VASLLVVGLLVAFPTSAGRSTELAPVRPAAAPVAGPWETAGHSPASQLECLSDSRGSDPLERRIEAELAGFTSWLSRYGEKGIIGEFGWWRDQDTYDWNQLAESWFRDLDCAGLWGIAWGVGPFDDTHLETPYGRSALWPAGGVDTVESQAQVLESHQTTDDYRRGIAVSGGSFGDGASSYSNEHPGEYGSDWFYETQDTFNFIADRGYDLVRIDFKWERIQPALNQPLDSEELRRLQVAVGRARTAGLDVVLDLHNYGAYFTANHERHPIGDAVVSIEALADVWTRLSAAFGSDSNVVAYGLMNEPHGIESNTIEAARMWERASQAAVSAIRAAGDGSLILVPGSNWSQVQTWVSLHPVPWIDDPLNNIMYEAHHYWTQDHSGDYIHSYQDEVQASSNLGY